MPLAHNRVARINCLGEWGIYHVYGSVANVVVYRVSQTHIRSLPVRFCSWATKPCESFGTLLSS